MSKTISLGFGRSYFQWGGIRVLYDLYGRQTIVMTLALIQRAMCWNSGVSSIEVV